MSTREISPPILTQRQIKCLEGLSEEYELAQPQGYMPVVKRSDGKLFRVLPNGRLGLLQSESYLGLVGD